MPEQDEDRWQRLASILVTTHSQLGWYVEYLAATVTQVELRLGCALGFKLGATLVEQQLLAVPLDAASDGRRATLLVRQQELDQSADRAALIAASELAERWVELRIAELAAEKLADSCFGRDVVHPTKRATLADCKERLREVQRSLVPFFTVELVEPDPSDVDQLAWLLGARD